MIAGFQYSPENKIDRLRCISGKNDPFRVGYIEEFRNFFPAFVHYPGGSYGKAVAGTTRVTASLLHYFGNRF